METIQTNQIEKLVFSICEVLIGFASNIVEKEVVNGFASNVIEKEGVNGFASNIIEREGLKGNQGSH